VYFVLSWVSSVLFCYYSNYGLDISIDKLFLKRKKKAFTTPPRHHIDQRRFPWWPHPSKPLLDCGWWNRLSVKRACLWLASRERMFSRRWFTANARQCEKNASDFLREQTTVKSGRNRQISSVSVFIYTRIQCYCLWIHHRM